MGIASRLLATKLINRSIIKVHGSDSLPYLQTFLTNDIRHIEPGSGGHCLYSHIINSMGRSLADVFLYQPIVTTMNQSVQRNLVLAPFYTEDFGEGGLDTDQVLVECDKSIAGGLQRTLFAMKIRKKVSIEQLDRQVWVIYPQCYSGHQLDTLVPQISKEAIMVPDPRLFNFGVRIVTPSCWNFNHLLELVGDKFEINESNLANYERYRYQTGISEGAKEHPEGHLFPLECNADLLNGISFKKGLFAGDWITGRNYRKGVHSRIVPFELDQSFTSEIDLVAPDTCLMDEKGKEIGSVRCRKGKIGLASIESRHLHSDGKTKFNHSMSNVTGTCWIPSWWPTTVQRVNERNIPDGKFNSYIIPESQR